VLKYLIFEVFLPRTLYDCEADSGSRLSKFHCNKFCGAGILPCRSYQWLNCRRGQWLHRARHKSKSSSVNFKHGWQEFTAIFGCSRLCQYPLSRVKGMPIYSHRLLVQWNILRWRILLSGTNLIRFLSDDEGTISFARRHARTNCNTGMLWSKYGTDSVASRNEIFGDCDNSVKLSSWIKVCECCSNYHWLK